MRTAKVDEVRPYAHDNLYSPFIVHDAWTNGDDVSPEFRSTCGIFFAYYETTNDPRVITCLWCLCAKRRGGW